MNKSIRGILFLLPLTFFLSGCEQLQSSLPFNKPAAPQGTVIAKVNDMYITQEQLNQELENFNALNALYFNAEAKKFNREEKISFLKEELVPRLLFYKEAKARKIDKQPKMREALQNMEMRILDEEFVKQETGNVKATEQEIGSFFETYKDRFKQEEKRRVREIVVASEEDAKEVMIELLRGVDFAVMAQQKSTVDSSSKGGDLGYVSRGERGEDFKKFDEVAFSSSLEKRQISPIFKDKLGYYIVRIDDIQGGETPALSDVKDQVKNALVYLKQQQKMQELKDSLSKKAKIEVYQEKVK